MILLYIILGWFDYDLYNERKRNYNNGLIWISKNGDDGYWMTSEQTEVYKKMFSINYRKIKKELKKQKQIEQLTQKEVE